MKAVWTLILCTGLFAICNAASVTQTKRSELTILEQACTTMRSGQVRYIAVSNLLEICSNQRWTPFSPSHRLRLGLIGHWKMDEQSGNAVDDDSGSGHHGIAANASPQPAKFTRGRRFRSSGSITIPNAPGLNLGTKSFSVAGWQNIVNVVYPRTTFAVRKGFGCYFGPGRKGWVPGFETGHGYKAEGTDVCIRDNLNNMVRATLVHDDGSKGGDVLNRWVHYLFTFDREAGVVTLYLNGRKQQNTVDIRRVRGSIDNDKPLEFGELYGWKTQGTLDDYRLYNYALSYHEAKMLYLDHHL
ncbi:predicted protein [Nematostella vectensis]|uniref:Uncharacterized protein n=1 Tax=Nematostella vectensis TaxID=45351 RepID=A7SXU0_NEMVE|nr:uncharacterized protein LOC5502397 isoform X1 [Nematostella vectensis]XP_048582185.1 uncharacterized protein LOC5502397 isoform X2 [Nematostella vectensis]EDO31494.1 predicted protein [Nematostella vectensis]|eukprot:XP_001623594.1 predicted protein [Nematostella vectensis]